jgi:hypothetical protein
MFGEFDEDAAGRGGMKKGDALSLGSNARPVVHQSYSSVTALLERPIEVVNREADVVDSRTPFFEEPADGGGGRVRLEKLDQRVPGLEAADPGAVAIGQVGLGHSEDIAIE